MTSAIIGETVSRIISSVTVKDEKSWGRENIERLEMGHIKMEVALQISDRWKINHAPLLQWRRKLKHAAQECDNIRHRFQQRALEEEEIRQEVSQSSFPKRIAHAAKSFTSYCTGLISNDESSNNSAIIRRFERFADGASEFLRFIELGGTPYRYMPFDSLVRHLSAGEELKCKIVRGNEYPSFLIWFVPFNGAKHGTEASLVFVQKDSNAPENNFFFSIMLQISESTDIVGITIKYLQLFAPHFKSVVEIIRRELTKLSIQDFSLPWVPFTDYCHSEHLDNFQSIGSQWFRPNPLCCKQRDQHELHHISNLDMVGLPGVSLEPVIEKNWQELCLSIEVHLYCQVSLSDRNKQSTLFLECKKSFEDSTLKVGFLFTPHGSSENMLPVNKSSATVAISGEGQHCLNTDIALEQVGDIMLPNAINYFHHNTEATVYQMLWKSRHSIAYIQVERENLKSPGSQRTIGGGTKRKRLQQQDQDMESQTHVVSQFYYLWIPHAPIHLQGSIVNWFKKQKEIELAAQPQHLKF